MRRFLHCRTVAALGSARLAPPLCRDGWVGEDKDSVHCGDVVFVKRAGGGRAVLVRRLCQVASSDGGVVQAVGVYSPPMLLNGTELCGE
jgi:hypothetical protein